MHPSRDPHVPGAARRTLAAFLSVVATIVWAHALAGLLRAAAGIAVEALAPASLGLTLGAAAAALAGGSATGGSGRAAARAGLVGLAAAAAIAWLHPAAWLPALALAPAAAASAAMAAWVARRLPVSLDVLAVRHPGWSVAWLAVALLAVVQVGRLATYMTDAESDWFLSTRNPFYAKHECLNAYVYAAELSRRGEPNVYDAAHYPGLTRDAAPRTAMRGMLPEDPFQYPPPFLLLPRLAIQLTHDYGAVRLGWFGLNATLCLFAVGALAAWIGGRVGTVAGLLSPALLASFPVLHDLQYGQFHFAAIALAVLGLLAFQRGRAAAGGALLAVAILAKLFPAVLLVPLAVQRRWRALAWTAGAGVALTALALLVLGGAPFAAFFDYQIPRLADGSAFAFGDAWPELAMLVTAGNQGIHGMLDKLAALGVPGIDASLARPVSGLFGVAVLALGAIAGRRAAGATRAERAAAWLGLLGLGSLASAGAWADYVPLTCVWVLTLLLPLTSGPWARGALVGCAVLQTFLLGTMPIGAASDARWMLPLSLFSAVAMALCFAAAVCAPASAPATARDEARAGSGPLETAGAAAGAR